jgi:nucleoid-associated protein YgaU
VAQSDATAATVAAAPTGAPAPGDATQTAALPGAIAPAPEPVQAAPAKPTAPAEGNAPAPAVLLADKGGITVMQPAAGSTETMQNVGIDAIAYSGTGAVELSGHGTASANVRIYIDNSPVITVPIGADGKWKLTLPDLHEGVYTLRADQIDAGGKVTSRFETPFKRESATVLTAARVIGGPSVGVRAAIITVQPGYTLWGIARANLGSGILYVKVFDANRDQIRNPDLIYPGQVFAVPGSN